MFKNPIVKNILSAVAVAVFGFILLNLQKYFIGRRCRGIRFYPVKPGFPV